MPGLLDYLNTSKGQQGVDLLDAYLPTTDQKFAWLQKLADSPQATANGTHPGRGQFVSGFFGAVDPGNKPSILQWLRMNDLNHMNNLNDPNDPNDPNNMNNVNRG